MKSGKKEYRLVDGLDAGHGADFGVDIYSLARPRDGDNLHQSFTVQFSSMGSLRSMSLAVVLIREVAKSILRIRSIRYTRMSSF